ncbi:MAG: hypothetical protein ABSF50_19620 [Burkholderiaceae bacterium]|jgi:hypothetical protein
MILPTYLVDRDGLTAGMRGAFFTVILGFLNALDIILQQPMDGSDRTARL